MKIVIVNSPLFRFRNELYDEDSLPPLGLGYLATALDGAGFKVELIDAVYERIPLDELITMIGDKAPDFIALNVFTTNRDLVKELVENINWEVKFIIGGLSTKQLYKEIIGWTTLNHIDIVTGDGEAIIVDIVNGTVSENPFFVAPGRNVYIVGKGSAYEVKDISLAKLDRNFFKNEPVVHPTGYLEANIVASRGCIYNCTFCAAARSLNADYSVRERSTVSILRELNEITTQFPGVTSIRVLDDLFLKHRKCVLKATDIFSKTSLSWRSMAHVMTFEKATETDLKNLKESGCRELFIGVESGSPKVLRAINKTSKVNRIERNLTKVLRAGIGLKCYFIYGFPEETLQDMEMTLQLANRLAAVAKESKSDFRTSVFQYRPYHGTQIYHDLQSKGADLNVVATEANEELSDLVGRQQFNFHSGNFSAVDQETLNAYIYRTININGGKFFPTNSEQQKAA